MCTDVDHFLRDMYGGAAKFPSIDNERYEMRWTTVERFFAEVLPAGAK